MIYRKQEGGESGVNAAMGLVHEREFINSVTTEEGEPFNKYILAEEYKQNQLEILQITNDLESGRKNLLGQSDPALLAEAEKIEMELGESKRRLFARNIKIEKLFKDNYTEIPSEFKVQ